jgi:tetratricopeptide (TPR) repeat protein
MADGAESTDEPTDGPESMAVEPPDDLDLTAREFGPNAAWQADEAPTPPITPVAVADEVTGGSVAASEGELAGPAPVVVEAPPAPAPAPPVAVESVAAAEAPPVPRDVPQLELTAPEFSAEEDAATPAFDLAAELSEALSEESTPTAVRSGSTDDEGFSALFREFKRGVSRTLDEGDVETHFDLGIAYREMGLFEDAIGEFRYALGSGARRLDALQMMGLCALDAGRGADAVGHLEQALASPELPDGREAPLRYDLGRVYEAIGDRARAIEVLERVVALDAGFQDAAERLEALRSAPAAKPKADSEEREAYESFDDLIAQTADEAPAEAEPVAETYESFDEFQGDADAEADDVALGEVEAFVAAEAEIEAPVVAEAVEPEPEPEPVVVVEEAPVEPEAPRRKRKISFF